MDEKLTAKTKIPCIGGPLDGKKASLEAPRLLAYEMAEDRPRRLPTFDECMYGTPMADMLKTIEYRLLTFKVGGKEITVWSCLPEKETLAKVIDIPELSL